MKGRAASIRRIPALSVLDGLPVVLGKKKGYEPLEDEDGVPIPAKEFVEELVKRHGNVIYLVDIDGIERNAPQYTLIKDLSAVADLWVDAGPRHSEAVIDVIVAGAAKGVISTRSMSDVGDLARTMDVTDEVVLCIDMDRDGSVMARSRDVGRMEPASLAYIAREEEIQDVVLADHGRRRKEGLNEAEIGKLVATGSGIWVGGRVVEDDLRPLAALGVKGAILDMRGIIRKW